MVRHRVWAGILAAAAVAVGGWPAIGEAAQHPVPLRERPATTLPATPAYQPSAVQRALAVLRHSASSHTIELVVDSPRRIRALEAYSAAVSNPQSPDFHRFLSPQALDARFGPTASVLRAVAARLTQAGWRVEGRQGLVVTAVVPASSAHPRLPVSPDIWSMSGFQKHGVILAPLTVAPPRVPKDRALRGAARPAATAAPDFSLANEKFHAPPVVLQQTTEANGDVVSIMSWNPRVATQVPAGLPINLFVTVEDPQGNFLPIANISNLNDSDNSLVSYGAEAMPDSSNTLWQIPLAAWRDVPPGDLLTLTATLDSGVNLNASFPLPAFTGSATALTPLDGQQANALSGLTALPSNPAPVALFAIGTPPSLKDLALYLDQNSPRTPVPKVTFHYEDGATPTEYGAAGDTDEAELDLQALAGAAPGAPIEDYIFPENDRKDPLISYLTDLSQQTEVKIASISYGFFGENLSTLTVLMDALTAEGITVVEASGDQGAWNGGSDPGPVGLSSLEQIPSVLSVGGLDIAAPAKLGSSGSTIVLTGPPIAKAWGGDYLNGIPVAVAQAYTNQNAASSGGYSTKIPVPSWEASLVAKTAPGFGVPILASLAGYPGLSGYLGGQNVVYGGTSLAAPLTAGWLDDVESLLNLSSTGLGNLNPLLFEAAKTSPTLFTQAQWGANGVYTVTSSQPGSWNPVTGLGLLNWGGFLTRYNTLVPTASPSLTLVGPRQASIGHAVTLEAYVRGMVRPLFQFSYLNPATDLWTTSGPFGAPNHYAITPKIPGLYVTRVVVKSATGRTLVRESSFLATTTLPMVEGLTLASSLKTDAATGAANLTVLARAEDVGHHPEYQFWLTGPGGRTRLVHAWSPLNVLKLTLRTPGRYHLTVDALDRTEVAQHNWAAMYRRTLTFSVGLSMATVDATGAQR
ncbi:MAG: protease pro-enzyme activation domain-containing protein [Firmicutes bacterium]|nr:protease pro-enzyme activation domain-containing protein [Bacillota bacterium]